MSLQTRARIFGGNLVLACASVMPAHADLSIAKAATRNVSCTAGSCVATARNAVMNVADLRNLLATESAVSLDAGKANNMTVDAALTWASSASLSLTARDAIVMIKQVTVAGHAAVNIQSKGFTFAPKGSLSFWDVSSGLIVNGNAYTLVSDIKSFQIASNYGAIPGWYALANNYDATPDGTYNAPPISSPFGGTFDGLGHTIANFSIAGQFFGSTGLFYENDGAIRNLSLSHASIEATSPDYDGLMVGLNRGTLDHVSVKGRIQSTGGHNMGGLAGSNDCLGSCDEAPHEGFISNSSANVRITGIGADAVGGLAGNNFGRIMSSYSEGHIDVMTGPPGGLVGVNSSRIKNCYSLVTLEGMTLWYGGLLGMQTGSLEPAQTVSSYSGGKIEGSRKSHGDPGGIVGYEDTQHPSSYVNAYWDTDLGVHSEHKGAGNVADQPGLTGLTDAQLKSGLPTGFDPAIWGQSPTINNGYPYLLSNPPHE